MSDLTVGSAIRGGTASLWAANSRSRDLLDGRLVLLLGFALVALLLRSPLFGDPVLHSDEQFYLLVGDRILHGALPYVDIWDRKPIGLFLLYAGVRRLGGDGIVEYQLAATACAALTALLVRDLARMLTTARNAFLAGVAYLTYLLMFDGAGGQSPVFYNLLVVGAVRVCASPTDADIARSKRTRDLLVAGACVNLLFGLAMQIKYTAVFEGVYFGLVLSYRGAHLFRSRVRLLLALALWLACALGPTAAAMLAYWHLGHLAEFIQANFLSIFNRHQAKLPALLRLVVTALALTPLVGCAVRGIARLEGTIAGRGDPVPLLWGWALAAIAGYLLFGSYFDHYALPLLAPLCILAAPGFEMPHRLFNERFVLLFALIVGVITVGWRYLDHGSATQLARVQRLVATNLHGCLYVYEGPSLLYKQTNACMVTRFAFPNHLDNSKEADALGVNASAETARLLQRSPSVIVMSSKAGPLTNIATRKLVEHAVDEHYSLAGEAALGASRLRIYALRPD